MSGHSDQLDGVFGTTKDASSAGIRGHNLAQGDGVKGEGRVGVHGTSFDDNNDKVAAGVVGEALRGFGVVGLSGFVSPAQLTAGVYGGSDRGPGVCAVGEADQPGLLAVGTPAILAGGGIRMLGSSLFFSNVTVLGTLVGIDKHFEIDHPLDPANKYLRHASVESPEMKTVYDGMVMLDENGAASVELPDWFEALNTTFRYQLTPIGAPAPELHVAREISDNRFSIAGGPPELQVCWQVTGVRQDRSAQARPLRVEEDKPTEERGSFLDPEAHGHSPELSVARIREPRLFQQPSV